MPVSSGDPRPRWAVLAGLTGGLATATKYNLGLFCAPLVVAVLLARRPTIDEGSEILGQRRRPPISEVWSCVVVRRSTLLAAFLASVAGYLIGTPYTVLDWPHFQADFLMQYRFGALPWFGQDPRPVALLHFETLLRGVGGPLLALALLGTAFTLQRLRGSALVSLSFPLVYLLFMLHQALFFPRFDVLLVPFVALYAAVGLDGLAGCIAVSWQAVGRLALVGLAVGSPLVQVFRHNSLLTRPDTRVLANEWVRSNVPNGSLIRVEDYSLLDESEPHRTYHQEPSAITIKLFDGPPLPGQFEAFLAQGVDYVVLSSFVEQRYRVDPARRREQRLGYEQLERDLVAWGRLVARFGPGLGGQDVPFNLYDMMTPFWDQAAWERPGPTLWIFALAQARPRTPTGPPSRGSIQW